MQEWEPDVSGDPVLDIGLQPPRRREKTNKMPLSGLLKSFHALERRPVR